ncbi:MAG: cysteine desulfurase [Gemmataceae bacterium]
MGIQTIPGPISGVNKLDTVVSLDARRVRRDFPILRQEVRGKPLVYLDNAATTQKPQVVIDALRHYYEADNANVHRGVHLLSERATRDYENARVTTQRFLNAKSSKEIIFTRGCTEAINLVASSWGHQNVGAGDEIVISYMEHHSNIVPWQMLCKQTGAKLKVIPINDDGDLLLDDYEQLLTERTKIVSLVHVSNTLGTVNPIKHIIDLAHQRDIPVLIDGAQAAPHMSIDVRDLDCEFYVFSGHKVYGPTGVGVLYGKEELLNAMPPYQGGGDMIYSVNFEETTYNELPAKFEAGTPNISGVIGLGAALDYVTGLDLDAVAAHEDDLLDYMVESLEQIPDVRLIGNPKQRSGSVSFTIEGIHPHDIGTLLDQEGVAIRTGHHCTQPLMERYRVPATSRASVGCYNTRDDVDALIRGIDAVKEVLG